MKNLIIVAVVMGLVAGVFFVLRTDESPAESPLADDHAGHSHAPLQASGEQPARPEPSDSGPWPSVIVEETHYDFGRMQVGAELENVFTIRNEGDATLELLAGRPTCKCTGFTLSQTNVEPGEECKLTVRWKGKTRDSNFSHGGPVYTNDPNRTTINFSVGGIVEAAMEILPTDKWTAGRITDESPGTMRGVVISRLHSSFEVSEVSSDSPHVKSVVTPLSREELGSLDALSGYEITLTVSPEVKPGLFETTVHISTDCVEEPASVILTGKRDGPIQILPSPGVLWVPSANGLKLGQFSAQKGHTSKLLLVVDESEMTEDLRLEDVTAKPSFLKAELQSLAKGNGGTGRYQLLVTVPPGIPAIRHGSDNPATLQITTNHPSGQVLELNISFRTF